MRHVKCQGRVDTFFLTCNFFGDQGAGIQSRWWAVGSGDSKQALESRERVFRAGGVGQGGGFRVFSSFALVFL